MTLYVGTVRKSEGKEKTHKPRFDIAVGSNKDFDHAHMTVDAGEMEGRVCIFIFIVDGVVLVAD